MEKDLFRKVLENYPTSSVEEAQELHSLAEAYPYSQLLRVLAARASKDHGLSGQQQELQMAAVYSADRSILKEMMSNHVNVAKNETLPHPHDESIDIVKSEENHTRSAKEEVSGAQSTETTEGPDDLAEKVIKDVKELYKTRHNFEMMFVENPAPRVIKAADTNDEQVKSKRERIIELSKALNAQPMTENEESRPAKKKREERKDIMDEIVHTKNKIEPENEKQKEQLEIIDQFIKTQPSISSAKDKPPHIHEGDLSSIKTGEFGENIVSETLVELLVKQGKKDKAIEVLKKLIWKFPQKKSYFAAQIEELKK